MATNFSKNAEERPEPVSADVKGRLSLHTAEHVHWLNNTAEGFGLFCVSSHVGNIPSWLQGTLLRNGPGIFSVGDTSYDHWFDGMAIMHSFTFKDGWSCNSENLFCSIVVDL